MNTNPDFYLVIDLEATCDENHRIPRAKTEIIEIGAVLVDAHTLQPVEEFATFVKPVLYRTLTPFCMRLTSIRQADVDAAPTFRDAITQLGRFLGGRNALFCSWGDYDRNQFERDAGRHGVKLPFRAGHVNLKKRFSDQLGETESYGLSGALRRVGLRFQGTAHRGIDDARNITRLLPWIFGKQRGSPL